MTERRDSEISVHERFQNANGHDHDREAKKARRHGEAGFCQEKEQHQAAGEQGGQAVVEDGKRRDGAIGQPERFSGGAEKPARRLLNNPTKALVVHLGTPSFIVSVSMALSSLASGTLSFPSGYGVSILLTLSAVAFGKAVSPESLPLWLTELRGRNPLSGGIALFLAAASALAAAHYDGHVFVPLKNAGYGLLFMSGVLTAAGDIVATWDRLKVRNPALEGGAS